MSSMDDAPALQRETLKAKRAELNAIIATLFDTPGFKLQCIAKTGYEDALKKARIMDVHDNVRIYLPNRTPLSRTKAYLIWEGQGVEDVLTACMECHRVHNRTDIRVII